MSAHPTAFTDLIGCRVPLQLAGMPRTSVPDLVVAVANAGGLGMFGGARASAAQLERDLAAISRRTDGAIGVTFLAPFLDPALVAVASGRVRVVELCWGIPDRDLIARIHAGGSLASWQVGTVSEARAAEAAGCDIVVVQGLEAGGHVHGTTPLAELLAAARAAVSVPLVGADPADTVLTTTFSHGWPNALHRVLGDCVRAVANAPDPVGELIDDGARISPPRGATPSPTRTTRGMIAAMPQHAGLSVGAVHAIRPAAAVVADLFGTAD